MPLEICLPAHADMLANTMMELVLEPQHDQFRPALQNQANTYETLTKPDHLNNALFDKYYDTFYKFALTLMITHGLYTICTKPLRLHVNMKHI